MLTEHRGGHPTSSMFPFIHGSNFGMQSVLSVRAGKKKHPQNNSLVLKLSTVHLNLLLNHKPRHCSPPAPICQKLLVNLRLANY